MCNLQTIKESMLQFIQVGEVSASPIELLTKGNTVFPKESDLWDYKKEFGTDPASLAKTIMSIVAFHNSYGGYLIYGIHETQKDIRFEPIDVDFSDFDLSVVRNLIKKYTNKQIDITFNTHLITIEENEYSMGLIHIPKRESGENPLAFVRDGPQKDKKPIFKVHDTYMRTLDEKIPAKSPSNWEFLFSGRNFPSGKKLEVREIAKSLDHNLPDRQLICSDFIGREDTLSSLWKWLSDDFEYTKILCGDGGKGKTSIAYEFSTRFVSAAPSGYERVVWLSVKEKQFSGVDNDFYDLNDSDFKCSRTFLLALSEKCSLESEDYDDVAISIIKQELRSALPIFPSLIIVDDIDSLEDDEQRKVVDSCRQLGSNNVRFLVTTRKKLAYSSDLCIDIPGMPIDEYSQYVDLTCTKYNSSSLNRNAIGRLHSATDGSPLLTSSILRLIKFGYKFDAAIKEWKGHAGEDARDAAIRREIDSLKRNSKRALLGIYYFGSCSVTELKQALVFQPNQLLECLEELQSLFLVSEPSIIEGEKRYSLSNTTALVVKSNERELALDFDKIKTSIKNLRAGTDTSGKQGNRKYIGLIIRQSVAFLKEEKYLEAIRTVDEGLKKYKENPDLLLMKARCLSEQPKPDYDSIKNIAAKAVKKGQKRERAFEYWYLAESETSSVTGIIECCLESVRVLGSNKSVWYQRLAKGYLSRAKLRGVEVGYDDIVEASNSLTQSLKTSGDADKKQLLKDLSDVHDHIWKILEANTRLSWLSSFDEVVKLIKKGDVRTKLYCNARTCLTEAEAEFRAKRKELPSSFWIRAKQFNELINSRNKQDKIDRPFEDLLITTA